MLFFLLHKLKPVNHYVYKFEASARNRTYSLITRGSAIFFSRRDCSKKAFLKKVGGPKSAKLEKEGNYATTADVVWAWLKRRFEAVRALRRRPGYNQPTSSLGTTNHLITNLPLFNKPTQVKPQPCLNVSTKWYFRYMTYQNQLMFKSKDKISTAVHGMLINHKMPEKLHQLWWPA